ncbi:MAG: hypothetical protein QXY76_04290 [Nitrososphaeria archaeon]
MAGLRSLVMAVRLKLKVRVMNTIEVIALLNSGYEAAYPQLLVPVSVAKSLGLWPPTSSEEIVLETGSELGSYK